MKKTREDDTIGIQNPVFAVLDAEARNKFYEDQWSKAAKNRAVATKNKLYEIYGGRPRVFLNYREKFIAIKVAQPKPSEKKLDGVVAFDSNLPEGASRIEKSGNVIYHFTKM